MSDKKDGSRHTKDGGTVKERKEQINEGRFNRGTPTPFNLQPREPWPEPGRESGTGKNNERGKK